MCCADGISGTLLRKKKKYVKTIGEKNKIITHSQKRAAHLTIVNFASDIIYVL